MPTEMTGRVFGRLVVGDTSEIRNGKRYWLCECSCGSFKYIYQNHILTGATKSCGCLRKEKFTGMVTKHGGYGTRLYWSWKGMIERCYYNKHVSYSYYGGRGIRVCPDWTDSDFGFSNFRDWALSSGYREGLTIDRNDNDKNYCPENCSWKTRAEQSQNKRSSISVSIDGERLSLRDISVVYSLPLSTVRYRYGKGLRGFELIKSK